MRNGMMGFAHGKSQITMSMWPKLHLLHYDDVGLLSLEISQGQSISSFKTSSIDLQIHQKTSIHFRRASIPVCHQVTMYRTALIRNARLFSTSTRYYKGPIETAKDAAKTVDRTVSDAAVAGIEAGGTSTPLSTLCAKL